MATYDDIFGDGNPYLNQETTPEITITPEEKEQNYFVETAKNVPSSFMNLVNAIAEPFKHPAKVCEALGSLVVVGEGLWRSLRRGCGRWRAHRWRRPRGRLGAGDSRADRRLREAGFCRRGR